MEQMAEAGGILLTAETYNAAKQFVEVRPLGFRAVRGVPDPVNAFQLTGLKHAPASERFRTGPKPSPLAGRSRELATLEDELANAIDGEAHVVGIVGEAGLGKSRLCFEFAEICRRKGLRVLEARVLAHGRATPLQLVLELLRAAFGIQPSEPEEVSRNRIREVLRLRGSFPETLPLILEFLGLADPTQPALKLDPTARKIRLLEFVRHFIHSRPRDEVAVAVIEDLHWIDAASEEFMEAVVDAVVGTKTVLIVNFRPGLAAPWMQRSHYRQISLAPLQLTEANQLLRDLTGNDASLTLVRRNIAERAQGNPFFLEELVRSLVDRGDFEGRPGAYRLRAGIDTIPLPVTVQAVLSARIDRLEKLPREVLQTAAVVGREVPQAVLERVCNMSLAEVENTLWQLRRAELLFELPPYENGLHAFRHPLIQEVAYRSLLHERRGQLHSAVARAVESVFGDPEHAAVIAFHREKAGEMLQAAQAHVRAAIWVGASDPSQALRTWKRVHELLVSEPLSAPADFLRMMACGQIVNFGWREGLAAEDARRYFEEARRLARDTGNIRADALIHASYGRLLAATGSADEYVAKIREAQTLAEESREPSLKVTLQAVLCHALRLAGRMCDALKVNEQALAHAHEISEFDRQMLGFDIQPWLTAMRGQTLVMLGRGDEAGSYLDQVIGLEPSHVDVTNYVIPSLAYVDLAWTRNDARMAEQHADRAFSLAIKSGTPYLRVYAQACRGVAHTIARRFDAAVEDLSGALGFARRRKAGLEAEARILADLSNVYRLKGDFASALCVSAEAIGVASARCGRVAECLARIVQAAALGTSRQPTSVAAARKELYCAESLIQETGAVIYSPLLYAVKRNISDAVDLPRQSAGAS